MQNAMNINTTQSTFPSSGKNDELETILRGEVSAVEAYTQVLEKIDKDPDAKRLMQFREDHERAVKFWKKEERQSGEVPEESSKVWGTVVEAFVGLSKLTGEENALRSLQKGEEYGLQEYESLLEKDLTYKQRSEIENVFIPAQKQHIASINSLIELT